MTASKPAKPTVKRKLIVRPDRDCKACHGTGTVIDFVPMPFGVGNTAMPSTCDCVWEKLPEDYEGDFVIEDQTYPDKTEGAEHGECNRETNPLE